MTLPHKIFVWLFITIFSLFATSSLFDDEFTFKERTLEFITTIGLGLIIFFFLFRFILFCRHIEMDDKNLYVRAGNFLTSDELVIPLKNVHLAEQNLLMRGSPECVIIDLLVSSRYGTRIYFIPKTRFFGLVEHPIVDKINFAAVRAKTSS